MTARPVLTNRNPVKLADVPRLEAAAFRRAVLDELADGGFLSAFFGPPAGVRVRV